MTVVAVVGLGYVGLPLAVEFGKKYRTIGFDLSEDKVQAYRRHADPTGEVSTEELKAARLLEPNTGPECLKEADFIIVAGPTPIDEAHNPDFGPLVKASETIGRNLKAGATVVFESTRQPQFTVARPAHGALRAGDVRHSLADISKAAGLMGYAPSHSVRGGLFEAIGWYLQQQKAAPAGE